MRPNGRKEGQITRNKYELHIGQRFGRLIIISDGFLQNGQTCYECICDCGNKCVRAVHDLVTGHVKSCGCKKNDGSSNKRHGLCHTRLYNIHSKMKSRCYTKTEPKYKYYGARGISVCDEWRGKNGVKNFFEWATANGYSDDLTIDRIDPRGDYCPENCRWADMETQENNRTSNHYITYNGETHTLAQWAKIYGMPQGRLYARLHSGWSVEKALTMPKVKR